MFASSPLPLAQLIELCHVLRIQLSAGLMLRDIFRRLSEKSSGRLRPVAGRIRERLDRGESFQAALEPEKTIFPPLFTAMSSVGEETGRLSEVVEELEKYFRQQHKYRREVRSKSILPVLQFFVALGVIALLIWVLGMLAQNPGGKTQPIFGLSGGSGALKFLGGTFILLATLFAVYWSLTRQMGKQATIDGLVWHVPVLGPCIRALVMGRFALAMQLTLDTAMPVARALRLSLQATGNQAFAQQGDEIEVAIREGTDLTEALGRGPMIPIDFIGMVAVGEEGGRLVEIMRHQAGVYQEEAGIRMQAVSRFATGAIWTVYAAFMVFAIFSLYRIYFGAMGL